MLPLNTNAELWYEFVTCQKHQKREQFLEKAACEERNGAQVNEGFFFFLRSRWELEGRFLLCSVFWLTFIAIGLWPLRNDCKQNPEVIPQLTSSPPFIRSFFHYGLNGKKADARKLNCRFSELMLPQRGSDSINDSKVCSLFICISLGGKMPN